ncbi:sulfatase family protein [Tundrisphaera lichenicola]|uniref:sulfatase family protein n=1 Tax=Tundrisphaera lichenicola TaxID=2029860 RepID=UPI003EC0D2EA
MRLHRLICGFCLTFSVASGAPTEGPISPRSPNIIYILADDLGFGDVACYNPRGKIATPQIDRLASDGMRFTDAHSGSAVCTPTRYGILTGRYSWRSPLKSGVLQGYSKRLIEPNRLTVPEFLRSNGYRTACIGKWHLGLDWHLRGKDPSVRIKTGWEIDYARSATNGPTAVGFDRFFGISASLDMAPFVFIDQDRSLGLPTVEKKWGRKGPAVADFEAIDVLPNLVRESTTFIRKSAEAARAGRPFFLYVPLSAPHTPILATPKWQGKSGINDYADFVMQVDDAVGQILGSLDRAGLAGETLVIFTSDNGCSPQADYPALLAKGHDPSAGFRGTKSDIFEGGHRVPFIVRWPGQVKPGTASDQVICLTDLFATSAEILGKSLPGDAAEDSVSLLPALLGTATGPLREATVHHSINGSFAIRQGHWKLALCPDSGGWSKPRPDRDEADGLPDVQLFNLAEDRGEQHNVQAEHPEIVEGLTSLLEKYVANGRSTPGQPRQNTGPVKIRKQAKAAP